MLNLGRQVSSRDKQHGTVRETTGVPTLRVPLPPARPRANILPAPIAPPFRRLGIEGKHDRIESVLAQDPIPPVRLLKVLKAHQILSGRLSVDCPHLASLSDLPSVCRRRLNQAEVRLFAARPMASGCACSGCSLADHRDCP